MLNSAEDTNYGGAAGYIAFAVIVGGLGTALTVGCALGARDIDRGEPGER